MNDIQPVRNVFVTVIWQTNLWLNGVAGLGELFDYSNQPIDS